MFMTIFLVFPQAAVRVGNKKQGSNTIMWTSFTLKFRSTNIIDFDIILSFTFIHS